VFILRERNCTWWQGQTEQLTGGGPSHTALVANFTTQSSVQFSSVRYTLKTYVLRACLDEGRVMPIYPKTLPQHITLWPEQITSELFYSFFQHPVEVLSCTLSFTAPHHFTVSLYNHVQSAFILYISTFICWISIIHGLFTHLNVIWSHWTTPSITLQT